MSKKTDLQDRALEKKLSITVTDEDDKERDLTIAELEELLAASEAFPNQDEGEADPELNALQERALEQELTIYGEPDDEGAVQNLTADELRASLADHAAKAKAAAADAQTEKDRVRQSAEDNPLVPAPKATAKGTATDVDAKYELGKPSKADKTLAKKHAYPKVIPGGKAYMSLGNINCVYGGGLRRNGQTIILTDAHAANKMHALQAL
jgi:hypothetical protein